MTSATCDENPADQMDEDNLRRTPATSHQLEPADDENVYGSSHFVPRSLRNFAFAFAQ